MLNNTIDGETMLSCDRWAIPTLAKLIDPDYVAVEAHMRALGSAMLAHVLDD